MHQLLQRLEAVESLVGELVRDEVAGGAIRALSDGDLVAALSTAGHILRLAEAALVELAGEVATRSSTAFADERLTTRLGCHNVSELIQRTTLVAPSTASRLARAASAVRVDTSLAGDPLGAPMPAVREALLDGAVGVDGVLAITGPLSGGIRRMNRDELLAADSALAAAARGEGPDGAPPACADLLKVQAHAWAVVLDEDGVEPRERYAMRPRSLTLGTPGDAGVPVRGLLMPEVAAQLQRIFDAHLSPKVDGVRFTEADPSRGDGDHEAPDLRTRPQRQHDALASALSVAASSGLLPTIGGAAPTLVVSVRAEDVARGRGYAHAEGCDQPVSVSTALHVGCAGTVQRVTMGDDGRIVRIGIEERVFNRHQRRAIALRDGGCIIPGCGVPAGWCEIHHVAEHALGGPTHTDNGVLLCWYHHRFVDRIGWRIRMNRGVPEVRAPGWYDASLRWRPVTRSPVRLRAAVSRT